MNNGSRRQWTLSNYNHLELVDVIVNSASKGEFETFCMH